MSIKIVSNSMIVGCVPTVKFFQKQNLL